MANAGGAWDNAKKIVETELKMKGTPLHDASIVGDTVGDPFKDTSSVAMNPVIKFTTLFGLLAVELGVYLSADGNATLSVLLAVGVLRGGALLRAPVVLRHADRVADRGERGGAAGRGQGVAHSETSRRPLRTPGGAASVRPAILTRARGCPPAGNLRTLRSPAGLRVGGARPPRRPLRSARGGRWVTGPTDPRRW